jgi:ubiquitin carboxyl-terminal hydrolase 22/27/51
MAGYDQQDAHEFFIALLDGLGSQLEKNHGIAHSTDLLDGSNSKYSFKGIANQLYSGTLQSSLTCLSCNQISHKYEPFVDLSLSIAPCESAQLLTRSDDRCLTAETNLTIEAPLTLESCLAKYTHAESLSEMVVIRCDFFFFF